MVQDTAPCLAPLPTLGRSQQGCPLSPGVRQVWALVLLGVSSPEAKTARPVLTTGSGPHEEQRLGRRQSTSLKQAPTHPNQSYQLRRRL